MDIRSTQRLTQAAALLGLALTISACGKSADAPASDSATLTERAEQKLAEKAMEKEINKDGANAKVDLSDRNGFKASGVDKDGKAFAIEQGAAKVSEQDMHLPFYPGAQAVEGKSSRMVNGGLSLVSIEMRSADDAAKVADWYRMQLKPRMAGNVVSDTASDGNTTLMVNDQKSQETFMLAITKDGDMTKIEQSYSVQAEPAGK